MKSSGSPPPFDFVNIELQQLFGILLELYEQRQNMARARRADRRENFLRGLDELYDLHVHHRRTFDGLLEEEERLSGALPERQLRNRIHQRHTRVRRDLLRWIDAQTRQGRGRAPISRATADLWVAAVCTILCERQSQHRPRLARGARGKSSERCDGGAVRATTIRHGPHQCVRGTPSAPVAEFLSATTAPGL